MPTQLALHFWPSWAHVFGIRVDYLAPTLYLTDLLLIVLIIAWINPLIRNLYALRLKPYAVILGFSILVFAVLNSAFAPVPAVSILKWLKVGELAFFVYFVKNFKKLETNKLVRPISFSLILFGIIGIVQFLKGASLGGVFYFLGERTFSLGTPSISTMAIFGREYLMPYSTFPHPNSLAGYFLVSTIFLLGSVKKSDYKLVLISLFVAVVTLILTFSLGVAVALVCCLILFFVRRNLAIGIFFTVFLLSLISPIFIHNPSGLYSESYFRRAVLIESAGKMISQAPLLGVGLNNFLVKLPEKGDYPSVTWWLQPVHNIFLLVFAETGIVGLLFFFYLIFRAFNKSLETGNPSTLLGMVSLSNHWKLEIALLAILITGVVDHYWLTLQQNQLLFALVLGLSLRKQKS